MGVSDREIQKKVFGPRWQDGKTKLKKQSWPLWRRLTIVSDPVQFSDRNFRAEKVNALWPIHNSQHCHSTITYA